MTEIMKDEKITKLKHANNIYNCKNCLKIRMSMIINNCKHNYLQFKILFKIHFKRHKSISVSDIS